MTPKERAAMQQALNWIDANAPRYVFEAIEKALAEQAEQEPVAFGCRFQDGSIHDCICPEEHDRCEGDYNIPLYAAPVRTKDLTDEEINELWLTYGQGQMMYIHEKFASAVIAADREKNNVK